MSETANLYRRWAHQAARGSSPTYERLALAVADDDAVLTLLESVEIGKRQPNLLFGALRWHGVPVEDPVRSLAWARAHPDRILAVLRTRRTQTNEVARCATILPALARLPEPLALIEVGASAGLCLLYDCWRYHYTGAAVDQRIGPASSPVTLSCELAGDVPLPAAVPTIAWRVGLDINPLDAREPADRRWLQCLVWPEHHDRARTLPAALDVAIDAAPRIEKGDLLSDLAALIEQAPSDATLVVVHSATLFYLDQHDREVFTAILSRHGAHRLGCEGPGVLPELTPQLPADVRVDGLFLLSLDDRVLGLAHPHGRTLRWLCTAPASPSTSPPPSPAASCTDR
ncbi:MAG: DUF2332 domain-containing protein [Pseudonocardiaceae bacterium]